MNEYEKFLNKKLKDKNTFVLTAENLLAIRNLKKKKILDVGIAEQSLIGIASGISKMGGKCYVHALSNFLLSRAYEFIKIDLDYNNCSCVLIGSMGGIQSTLNGPTHQSIDEISILENFKNFEVFFPFTINEMVEVLKRHNFKKSLYVRYISRTHQEINFYNKKSTNNFLIGKGKILLISNGIVCNEIYKIIKNSERLQKKFKLFNLSYLKNKNLSKYYNRFKKYKKILVIEDHLENCSIYSKLNLLFLKKKNYAMIKSINLGNKYFISENDVSKIVNNMGINEKKLMDIIK